MGVNSLLKTVTRQRRDCDLNPDPSAPESSTLTTRLPSHPRYFRISDRPTILDYSLYETYYRERKVGRNGRDWKEEGGKGAAGKWTVVVLLTFILIFHHPHS